jgi:hypothetical protein
MAPPLAIWGWPAALKGFGGCFRLSTIPNLAIFGWLPLTIWPPPQAIGVASYHQFG